MPTTQHYVYNVYCAQTFKTKTTTVFDWNNRRRPTTYKRRNIGKRFSRFLKCLLSGKYNLLLLRYVRRRERMSRRAVRRVWRARTRRATRVDYVFTCTTPHARRNIFIQKKKKNTLKMRILYAFGSDRICRPQTPRKIK